MSSVLMCPFSDNRPKDKLGLAGATYQLLGVLMFCMFKFITEVSHLKLKDIISPGLWLKGII